MSQFDDLNALKAELLRRIDKDGQTADLIEWVRTPLIRALLKTIDPRMSAEVQVLSRQAQSLVNDIAQAVALFTPLGWAPSQMMPQRAYEAALATWRRTGSLEEAERKLIRGWNDGQLLEFMLMCIKSLGFGDPRLADIAGHRYLLAKKALEHHRAKAYEASVPIVMFQVEGIVRDLTGKDFFDPRNRALLDAGTLLGMDETLAALHVLLSAPVKQTSATGGISRHDIVHGRELRYDTLINSTKCFALLFAVVEWGQPRAKEEAERRRGDRERRYAGSKAVDEDGRRLDRRGFAAAKTALSRLECREIAEFHRRGHYMDDLEELYPSHTVRDDWLPGFSRLHLRASADRQTWWAWYVTEAGYVFGLAARGGEQRPWRYDGPEPPDGGIEDDSRWVPPDDFDRPDWWPE